jgi:hypothetical protein
MLSPRWTAWKPDRSRCGNDFLDELGKTRSDLMGKIADLKGEVTRIRDDISVNMGAVDMARQVNDSTRAELRTLGEQVSVMYRRMLKLEVEHPRTEGRAVMNKGVP